MKPGHTGFVRIAHATRFTWQGLKACWRHESAFRQEVVLVVVAVPLALMLGQSPLEQALLIASVLLILIVELLNSAIETLVDWWASEAHHLAGRAKDIGSAAVALALLLAGLVWLLLLWP